MGDEEIVQASGPGETDRIGGIKDARPVTQQLAGVIERNRRHEFLGRESGPTAEQMVQFVGRDAAGVGDRLDVWLGSPMLRDEGDGASNQRIVVFPSTC